MPPKVILSNEQIIFLNVSYSYVQNKGLHLRDIIPYLFHAHFNVRLSYSTLSKYVKLNSIDLDNYKDMIQTSKIILITIIKNKINSFKSRKYFERL